MTSESTECPNTSVNDISIASTETVVDLLSSSNNNHNDELTCRRSLNGKLIISKLSSNKATKTQENSVSGCTARRDTATNSVFKTVPETSFTKCINKPLVNSLPVNTSPVVDGTNSVSSNEQQEEFDSIITERQSEVCLA